MKTMGCSFLVGFDAVGQHQQHGRQHQAPSSSELPAQEETVHQGAAGRRAVDMEQYLQHHADTGGADQAGGGGAQAVEGVGDIACCPGTSSAWPPR